MNLYIFAKKLGMSQIFQNSGLKIPVTFLLINSYSINNKNYLINNTNNNLVINNFQIGEKIKISGISIGKGNQGNIKRNNFKRGPMSHGSKHHRLQGSLGAGTTPGRVFPGKKMAGRTGGKNVTINGLTIIDTFLKNNILAIKGSIPGKFGNSIIIKKKYIYDEIK